MASAGTEERTLPTKSGSETARPTRAWPADQIEHWPIERLTPYANNPRLHSEADIDRIGASICRWGWTMPPLIDEEGGLICGHARVAAATRLGHQSIPVIVARGWSEEEKRAYRLADNQLAERASWDSEQLRSELRDLEFSGFDLDLIGFEADQLTTILGALGSSGVTDPDSVPQVPDQPVTQLGDLWLLGDHGVGCGDSTSSSEVAPVLAGSQPHLMVTDPPTGSAMIQPGGPAATSTTASARKAGCSTTIAPTGRGRMRCSPGMLPMLGTRPCMAVLSLPTLRPAGSSFALRSSGPSSTSR